MITLPSRIQNFAAVMVDYGGNGKVGTPGDMETYWETLGDTWTSIILSIQGRDFAGAGNEFKRLEKVKTGEGDILAMVSKEVE